MEFGMQFAFRQYVLCILCYQLEEWQVQLQCPMSMPRLASQLMNINQQCSLRLTSILAFIITHITSSLQRAVLELRGFSRERERERIERIREREREMHAPSWEPLLAYASPDIPSSTSTEPDDSCLFIATEWIREEKHYYLGGSKKNVTEIGMTTIICLMTQCIINIFFSFCMQCPKQVMWDLWGNISN